MPDFHESETIQALPDPYLGQLINHRYKVVRLLGQGGFGAVYLTEDQTLGNRKTVIKFLHRSMMVQDAVRVKFEDEKMALVRLSAKRHGGIGDIYDSGVLPDGTPYLAMEFIEGVSLRDRLLQYRQAGNLLPLNECATILEQLGDALTAAHEVGVIHRDVKPDNLMLVPQPDGTERLVVIDFGIARLTNAGQSDPSRPMTSGMGTLEYAAPEQLMPNRNLGPTCDIYAMAAMAFEMLAGRYAFPDSGLHMFFPQREEGLQDRPSAFRSGLSPRVDELVAAALNYDPDLRPRNARAFGKELAAALLVRNERQQPAVIPQPVVSPPLETDLNLNRGTDPPRVPVSLPATVRAEDSRVESDARVEQLKAELSTRGTNRKKFPAALVLVAGVFLIGAIVTGVWMVRKSAGEKPKPDPVVTQLTRQFVYAIEIQKMRDGKPFGDPYFGTGREVFETGYKFRLEITPMEDGELFVFAEGRDASGKPQLNLLFPTPKRNNGSSSVTANQKVQTGLNDLAGSTGNEVVYIVTTAKSREALANARQRAFDGDGSIPDGKEAAALRDLLKAPAETAPKVDFSDDEKQPRVTVKGTGETVVYRLEIKHR